MTYASELDDRRQEVRYGSSGQVYFWPKILGTGNVLAGSATYTLTSPDGASIGSGSATATTIDGVTRYSVTVDASTSPLGEGYRCQITWAYASSSYVASVRYDVVREPYSGEDVGINDLLDEVADLRELLLGQAQAHGTSRTIATTGVSVASNVATATVAEGHGVVPGMRLTSSGHTTTTSDTVEVTAATATTISYPLTASDGAMADGAGSLLVERSAEEQAAMLAMHAWQDIRAQLRSQLQGEGRIYPRLILDREGLRRVVAAQAVARAYRARGGGLDSASRTLAEDWAREAQARLSSLGPMAYDSDEDEDGTADASLSSGTVRVRRSWT